RRDGAGGAPARQALGVQEQAPGLRGRQLLFHPARLTHAGGGYPAAKLAPSSVIGRGVRMPDASLDLRQLLSTVPIFAGLSGADLDALAERFTPVELAPGEHLMRRGEVGEFMCLLAAGELTVEVGGAAVDRLRPGAVVGERALISVPERSADVAAGRGGAKVWRLARAEFERLAATHPSLLAAVHEVARPRLERAQLAPLLADRFGASTDAEVAQWQALARWRRLVRGEALYRRGEPVSEVYLVVSGCLEVREASGERVRVAGRGAVV